MQKIIKEINTPLHFPLLTFKDLISFNDFFPKFGVLKSKELYNKDKINKMKFNENKTQNKLTKKSFVEKFLSSVKAKMYGNR